jgi:preprotein translocase subunit SecG
MITFITIIHVFVCLFLILVVLLQAGKGGGMGVAFGSGTSAAVFGGRGAGSFLERLTAGTAIVFMLTSMTLAYYASKSESAGLKKRSEDAQQKINDKKAADAKEAHDAAERAKQIAVPPPGAPAAAPTPSATPKK